MIIVFYDSVKSADIKAMSYTLQRALLILANHIHAWTKGEGLVIGNLTLKEFQTQAKSISVHITWAAHAPVSIFVCADLFALFVEEAGKQAPTSALPVNNLRVACVRGARLCQMSTFCQGVQNTSLSTSSFTSFTSSHLNPNLVTVNCYQKREPIKATLEVKKLCFGC